MLNKLLQEQLNSHLPSLISNDAAKELLRSISATYDRMNNGNITLSFSGNQALSLEYIIAKILSDSHSVSDFAPSILKAIGESQSWDVAAFWILDDKEQFLELSDIWSCIPCETTAFSDISSQFVFPADMGLPGKVLSSGEILCVKELNVKDDCPRSAAAIKCGLSSAFAFPVVFNNKVLGVFEVFNKDMQECNEQKAMMLRTIGSLVGQALIRIKSEEALRLKNEELIKLNSSLDKFVYCVSHDLRAPLSSMLGIVQLSEDDTTDELMKENLSYLKSSIVKLDNFIQDILNYSRNSRAEIKKSEINFQDMLNDIATNHKYMNGAHQNVNLEFNIKQDAPYYSDKTRMNIILSNLISNAIRYHNPNASQPFVKVNVNATPDFLELSVKDNGIGISKELHDKVFDMFYRVSESSSGTGLGLYIVKESVEKIGGEIIIQSEPGKGTEFIIRLHNQHTHTNTNN